MKQIIRLTESDLHRIVNESVNKVLNEEYVWWGDTKPLEVILSAVNQITNHFEESYPEDYEFEEEDRARLDLYKWAKKIGEEAEEFIRYNADNTPINGGENW